MPLMMFRCAEAAQMPSFWPWPSSSADSDKSLTYYLYRERKRVLIAVIAAVNAAADIRADAMPPTASSSAI